MPGVPVKPTVLAELTRQLNHELSAAHNYVALGLWCDDQNLKGFARFFYKQASEEREHASKFMTHLIDRGVLPELASISTPKGKFESLMAVANQARAMEQANTAGINAAYEVAVREKDYPAQVLLQWFINEQVEEEKWADEMVERIEVAGCAGGLMDLDRHIERYLSDEPEAA